MLVQYAVRPQLLQDGTTLISLLCLLVEHL
uniref:VAMP-like protein YKT61 n=1 Tax=Rhizophora mucronata TaxID=61149 RepID=A0A2P2R1C6_RHIMU